MKMRCTPSSPTETSIPEASSLIAAIPALTAFPFFGYLNFHFDPTTVRAHEEEVPDD
jgi:hypothetical protein